MYCPTFAGFVRTLKGSPESEIGEGSSTCSKIIKTAGILTTAARAVKTMRVICNLIYYPADPTLGAKRRIISIRRLKTPAARDPITAKITLSTRFRKEVIDFSLDSD